MALIIFLVGLLGLCVGSFIHLIISRFSPNQKMIDYFFKMIFGCSKCPCCQNKLKLPSLIPVISWLILRGRCCHCKARIALHYPITELAVSTYSVLIIAVYGLTFNSMIFIFFGLYFSIMAIIDIKYLLLPNCFTYPIIITGLAASYCEMSFIQFNDALLGLILGYLLLSVPAALYYLVHKKHGLGGGDIKLLSGLATWIPYTYLPNLLLIASIFGMSYFTAVFLIKNMQKKTQMNSEFIPFGPCLLLAAYYVLWSLLF